MKKITGQQFLRQQIAFARIHLDSLIAFEASGNESKFRENCAKQAILTSLEKGLCFYVNELLASSFFEKRGTLEGIAAELLKSSRSDYRVSELKSTWLDLDSPLRNFSYWLSSLVFKLIDWQLEAPPQHNGNTVQATNLIASNSAATVSQPSHWTKVTVNDFEKLLAWVSEMLDRHSSNDEEF